MLLWHLLIVGIRFSRLPGWINRSFLPRLCFLSLFVVVVEVQDMDNLARLPGLNYLELDGYSWPPGYSVGTDDFKNLRFCKVGTALKFHMGAMPRLEELKFEVFAGHWCWEENDVSLEQFPTKDVIKDLDLGLDNLLSLEKVIVTVNCSGATVAKVQEVEAAVMRAVKNHPNRPTMHMSRAYEERLSLQTIRRRHCVLQLKDEPDAFFINNLQSHRCLKKAVISIDCTGANMCEVETVEACFRLAAEVHRNHPTIQLIRANTEKMVSSSDHTDTELDDDHDDSPDDMLCKLQLDDNTECHDLPQLGSTALVFSIGASSEEHHDSTSSKRCAHRKRRSDSAINRKTRPSTTRLAEKERPNFEDPSASRVQVADADFSGDDDHGDSSLDNLLCKLQLRN